MRQFARCFLGRPGRVPVLVCSRLLLSRCQGARPVLQRQRGSSRTGPARHSPLEIDHDQPAWAISRMTGGRTPRSCPASSVMVGSGSTRAPQPDHSRHERISAGAILRLNTLRGCRLGGLYRHGQAGTHSSALPDDHGFGNWSYLVLTPRAASTGYLAALAISLLAMAVLRSTPSTSARRMR